MKKMTSVLIALFLSVVSGRAQVPDLLWTRLFGEGEIDFAERILLNSDGTFVVVGTTNSFNAARADAWLSKFDAAGNNVWTNGLGGDRDEAAYGVVASGDGGYVLSGYTESIGPNGFNACGIRTNSVGDSIWMRAFGGGGDEIFMDVCAAHDGGFVFAGWTTSFGAGNRDVYVVKTNSAGVQQWTRTFGTANHETAYALEPTPDGGYLIAGVQSPPAFLGIWDNYYVKIDVNGNLIWSRVRNYPTVEDAKELVVLPDGSFAVLGSTFSAEGYDFYMERCAANGDTLWTHTYSRPGTQLGEGIDVLADGGFILSGWGADSTEPHHLHVVRTNSAGEELWYTRFQNGDGFLGNDLSLDVKQTADGGFLSAGWSNSFGPEPDMLLMKWAADAPLVTPLELVIGVSGANVQLSWTGNPASTYHVYSSSVLPVNPGTLIGTVVGTSFVLPPPQPGAVQYFAVRQFVP